MRAHHLVVGRRTRDGSLCLGASGEGALPRVPVDLRVEFLFYHAVSVSRQGEGYPYAYPGHLAVAHEPWRGKRLAYSQHVLCVARVT